MNKYKLFYSFEELMTYMSQSRIGCYKNKDFYKDPHYTKKIGKANSGENHWKWKGGISKIRKTNMTKTNMTRKEYLKSNRNPFFNSINNPKFEEKRIKALKEKHKDPEYQRKRLKALMKKPTKPETILIDLFKEHNLPYKYVGDGEVIIGRKNPDFINCNGQKKIIEMFGDIYHDPQKTFKKNINWNQTEFGTKAIYSQYGFKTLIIWESELKDMDNILKSIKNFEGL